MLRLAVVSLAISLAGPPSRAEGPVAYPANSPLASDAGDELPERPAYFRKRSQVSPAPAPLPEAPCPAPAPSAQPSPVAQPPAAEPSFGEMAFGAGVGSNVALSPGGYIDDAVIRSNFRARWEYGFDMNRPDRAEFFYAAWRELSFHPHNILNEPGTFQAAQDRGMNPLVTKLNYQETSAYLELAGGRRASIFAEVPWRMLAIHERGEESFDGGGDNAPDPAQHEALETFQDNAGGLGDIILGFKVAPIACPDRYLTFQFRVFFPSGDARNGLGTGHYSAEAGLLYYGRPTERLSLLGQFKAWVPIDGTTSIIDGRSFAGNVLIYGLGVGYDLIQGCRFRLTPVAEFVGWTMTNGLETVFLGPNATFPNGLDHGVADVSGVTIINGKVGMRAYFGDHDDVYVGFGQALTTEHWYNQIIRVEYRRSW
jgi:hypothetical protein